MTLASVMDSACMLPCAAAGEVRVKEDTGSCVATTSSGIWNTTRGSGREGPPAVSTAVATAAEDAGMAGRGTTAVLRPGGRGQDKPLLG